MIGPERIKLAVIAENLGGEETPFSSPAATMFKNSLVEAGISPDRLGFGWATEASLLDAEERGASFLLLAGDAALHLVRPDLSVGECHGRAMLFSADPAGLIVFPVFHPESYFRNPRWRSRLVEELRLLRAIGVDRDSWVSFTPDSCVRCRGEFYRVDDQGVVFCVDHWGKPVDRSRLLSADDLAGLFGGVVVSR